MIAAYNYTTTRSATDIAVGSHKRKTKLEQFLENQYKTYYRREKTYVAKFSAPETSKICVRMYNQFTELARSQNIGTYSYI